MFRAHPALKVLDCAVKGQEIFVATTAPHSDIKLVAALCVCVSSSFGSRYMRYLGAEITRRVCVP